MSARATGMGSFSQIERDFRRALGLAQETGNRVQESIIWSTLGHFYTVSGDYRQAQKALLAGEEIERDQPELWRKWVTLGYVGARKMQMGWLGIAQGRSAEASDRLAQIGIHHYEVKARLELGLAHHLLGDNVHALQELNHALSLASDYGDIRSQALANTRLGYALEAIGELADAYRHYVRGRDLHQQMGQDYYAMNSLAGLARIASSQGDHVGAREHAESIWDTTGFKEMDATIETARTLRTCYQVFDAHDDPRSEAVLEMAWDQLRRRASTIEESDDLEQFWQLEEHRFFRRIGQIGP